MNIGFDLDKVFIDYPPFVPTKLIDRFYKKRDNGILLYRIPGKIEQKIRMGTHLPLLRPVIKENYNELKKIAKEKHNLYLISSRFSFLKKRTDELVKKQKFNIIFKKLFFNYNDQQPHEFKNEVIKKLKLDKYIDDDLSLIKYVAKYNKNTHFFWLNPVENKKISPNISAITQLSQAFNK